MKPSERLIHRLVAEGVIASAALSLRGVPEGGISIFRDTDHAEVARSGYKVMELLDAETIRFVTSDGVAILDIA